MKRTTTLATLAVTGAVAFSPLLAFANSPVVATDAKIDVNTEVHHDSGVNASVTTSAKASSSAEWNNENGMHASTTKEQNRIAKDVKKGSNAINERIATLQKLQTRVNAMTALTAAQKSSISAELSTQITALTALKAKISSDVSTTTLIADLKALRPDYRTYLLVMPRTAIIASADRVMTLTNEMNTVGSKLQTRITAAQNAGVNVSSAQSAYADYQAKVADAKVQAQAALDLVVNLKVDQGDAATLSANTAALKSARTKLAAAQADLKAARKDMNTIMKVVKGKGVSATASTTAETH